MYEGQQQHPTAASVVSPLADLDLAVLLSFEAILYSSTILSGDKCSTYVNAKDLIYIYISNGERVESDIHFDEKKTQDCQDKLIRIKIENGWHDISNDSKKTKDRYSSDKKFTLSPGIHLTMPSRHCQNFNAGTSRRNSTYSSTTLIPSEVSLTYQHATKQWPTFWRRVDQ